MNTNKLLNNILGTIKKEQSRYKPKKFNKFKPLKQKTIAGKSVQVFNKHPIPKKHIIKKAYKKIPDDLSTPLQFMTRKQYLKKYVKNQELQNGSKFDMQTKQEFFKDKKSHYNNILGRYTTKSNPHYPAAVVVFNDPSNFKNIKGHKFDDLVFHEYGHELVEKQGMTMPLYKEEMFADHIADYGQDKKIFSDKRAKNYALKKLNNIKTDKKSKNKWDFDKAKKDVNYHISSGNKTAKIDTIPVHKINIKRNFGELQQGDNVFLNSQTSEREPIKNLAKMINSDVDLVELPFVSKKSGRYEVSDGRHRIMATADILNNTEVPVIIYKDEDIQSDKESKNMSWNYKGKIYPDIVDEEEEYWKADSVNDAPHPKVFKDKKFFDYFRQVKRLNEGMTPEQTAKNIALLETADKIKPGSIKYLVDNNIMFMGGDTRLDEAVMGQQGGFLPKDGKDFRGVLFQKNTAHLPEGRKDIRGDILTFNHELAHAKRHISMTDKGLEPFNQSNKTAWKQEDYKKNIGQHTTEHGVVVSPSADYEIEAEKHKARIINQINKKGINVENVYNKEYEKIQSDKESKNKWDDSYYKKSGVFVTKMSPQAYLERTSKLKIGSPNFKQAFDTYWDDETEQEEPIQKLAEHIKSDTTKVEIPYIKKNNDHEGRHRSWAHLQDSEEDIHVATTSPDSWRSDDVRDAWLQKRFGGHADDFREKWTDEFKRDFPSEIMDLQARKDYIQVLKDKGVYGEAQYIQEDVESKNSSKPNKLLMERIKKLPINYAYEDDNSSGFEYESIFNKNTNATKDMKQGKRNLLHSLKKHPYLMSEIEKRNNVNINIGNKNSFKTQPNWVGGYQSITKDENNHMGQHIFIKPEHSGSPTLLMHELKHVDQDKNLSFDNEEEIYEGIDEYKQVSEQYPNPKDLYDKVPYEREAELYAWNEYIKNESGIENPFLANSIVDKINKKISNNELDVIGKKHKKNVIEQRSTTIRDGMTNLFNDEIEEDVESKNSSRQIKESDFNKSIRLNRGMNNIITIDANKFKQAFENKQQEPLEWNNDRRETLKDVEVFNSYPELSDLNFDVSDGRHRIGSAARNNQLIDVSVSDDFDKTLFLEKGIIVNRGKNV